MTILGRAVLQLVTSGAQEVRKTIDGLRVDLGGVEKANGAFANSAKTAAEQAQKGFGGVGSRLKGVATNIPLVGGALGQLLTPVGLASAAVGGLVTGLTQSVTKITNLERELRPMIQRSGIAAESLQVLTKAAERLGSEDALEGVTDSSQELQLRLAEAVQDGTGPAVAAFEKLGLSSEELVTKLPEQAFLDVITALQGVNNEADRKFLADELMGGSSEKLAGVLNSESAAFKELTADIRENADIISEDALDSAKGFNEALRPLQAQLGRVRTAIGTALLPVLTKGLEVFQRVSSEVRERFQPVWEILVDMWQMQLQPALEDLWNAFRNDLLPALQSVWEAISPVLMPVLKALATIVGTNLKLAFSTIAGSIRVVSGLLTGDFTKAWQGIQQVVLSVLLRIGEMWNAVVGSVVERARDFPGGDLLPDLTIPLDAFQTKLEELRTPAKELADAEKNIAEETDKATKGITRQLRALRDLNQAWQEAPDSIDPSVGPEAEDRFKRVEEAYKSLGRTVDTLAVGDDLDEDLDAGARSAGDAAFWIQQEEDRLKQEAAALEEAARKRRELLDAGLAAEERYNEGLENARTRFLRRDEDLTIEFNRRQRTLRARQGDERTSLMAKQESELTDLRADFARETLDLQRDLASDIAQINRERHREIAAAERAHQNDLEDALEEHQQRLRDLARDAAHEREDMETDRSRRLEDINREHEQAVTDLQGDPQRAVRVAALIRDRDRAIEELNIDHNRRLDDILLDEARQREGLATSFIRQREEMEEDHAERIQEINIRANTRLSERQHEHRLSMRAAEEAHQAGLLEAQSSHENQMTALQAEHGDDRDKLRTRLNEDREDNQRAFDRAFVDLWEDLGDNLRKAVQDAEPGIVAAYQHTFDEMVRRAEAAGTAMRRALAVSTGTVRVPAPSLGARAPASTAILSSPSGASSPAFAGAGQSRGMSPGEVRARFGNFAALAEGAIVTRPTVAALAENFDPEAIIPLKELPGMMGRILSQLNLDHLLKMPALPDPVLAADFLSSMSGGVRAAGSGDTVINVDIHAAGSVLAERDIKDLAREGALEGLRRGQQNLLR